MVLWAMFLWTLNFWPVYLFLAYGALKWFIQRKGIESNASPNGR